MIVSISDLHGRDDILRSIVSYFPVDTHFITLGDVIDRGMGNKAVLQMIADLQQQGRIHCLKGNHEQMALLPHEAYQDYAHTRDVNRYQEAFRHFRGWMNAGGDKVRREFKTLTIEHYPETVLNYLNSCLPILYVQGEHMYPEPVNGAVMVSHAVPPVARQGFEPLEAALWLRPFDGPFPLPEGTLCSVHGHTPFVQPSVLDKQIYTDLGSYGTGRVCCLRLDTLTAEIKPEVWVFEGTASSRVRLANIGRVLPYHKISV